MNPRKMQQMMKQLGIQQTEIPATEVIIRTKEKDFRIANPSVSKVNMMGQETFQITGEVEEMERDTTPVISDEDLEMVMKQAGVNKEEARIAIEEAAGDLAEAIMKLKNKQEIE